MAAKRIALIFLVLLNVSLFKAKGLFSGVPCHRPYECIFEDNDDGFDNSDLVGREENIVAEAICQRLCRDTDTCVSYTWRTEEDASNQYLCQLFSKCHRAYQDPDLTTVYSGNFLKCQAWPQSLSPKNPRSQSVKRPISQNGTVGQCL